MSMHLDPEPNVHVFDARGIARRFRHSAIFGALGALRNGETMRFTYSDQVFVKDTTGLSGPLTGLPRLWATRKIG